MKSKHVALLIVVAAVGAFGYLQLRQRSADTKVDAAKREVAAHTASDPEIHAFYVSTVKPALGPETEPPTIARPILPIVPPPLAGGSAKLDLAVYDRLPPAERTDRLASAGSIAVVERFDDGFYGGAISKTVSSSAAISVFDIKRGVVVGRLVVRLKNAPPPEATARMVDDYVDQLLRTIAGHLQSVPGS